MKLTHRQALTLVKIVDDAILKATEIMAEWDAIDTQYLYDLEAIRLEVINMAWESGAFKDRLLVYQLLGPQVRPPLK
jgi:hypothetical protein